MVIIPPASAVTKCVKLNSSADCYSIGITGESNWSASCNSVPVAGVAFCGSQNGGSFGATTDAVTASSSSDDNKYCWCKMVSPAVSQWVFCRAYGSAGNCISDCADMCNSYGLYDYSFRSAMFGSLSD